jgi:hypothetical protein
MTLQAVMLVLLGLLAVLPTTSASRLTLINLNVNTAGLSIYTPCDSIAVFPCTTTELSVCLSLSLFRPLTGLSAALSLTLSSYGCLAWFPLHTTPIDCDSGTCARCAFVASSVYTSLLTGLCV